MYRGAGLENAVIIASSIDTLKLPDASTFAGTAITQAAGGLGSAIHVSNVMMLGFLQCFDGSNGGATIDFRNLVGDCVKGFDFGTSQGTSFIDAIKLGPYLTAGFSGYRILSVIGDGKTVKIGYIGPKIRVGDRISLRGVSIPNVNDETPYKVTSSSGSASKSDLSTATFAGAGLNGPGLVRGTAQYYDAQYLRQGGTYGFKFSNRSDDSHFGSLGDFGHDISLEASSAGFLSGDHLWCDNNAVACIKNVGHFDLQIGGVTAANTRNAYLSAGGSQPVVSAIGRLVARSTYEDCIVVNSGVLFVAYLDCGQVGVSEGGYAINIGDPTAYVTIAGGSFSQLSTGAIASAAPPDHLSINVKWIDAAPGASLYTGGSMKITSIASAATLRLLPTSSMTEVTGTNTISSISGAWAGREYLFVCTEACVFSGKGGIRGFTITLKRGLTKLTGPGAFRFVYSTDETGTWERE